MTMPTIKVNPEVSEFIEIDYSENTIKFKLQREPIGEVGKNGCQVDDIISAVIDIITGFNKNNPCRENSLVLTKLEEANLWLIKRTLNREALGIEGVKTERFVYINGTKVLIGRDIKTVSTDALIELTNNPALINSEALKTITYSGGAYQMQPTEGSMVPGDIIEIANGMNFNISIT